MLHAPIYGTKAELWARLEDRERVLRESELIREALAQREQDMLENAAGLYVPMLMPAIAPPTDLERTMHELTHIPTKVWCEFCQRGKGNDRGHRQIPLHER